MIGRYTPLPGTYESQILSAKQYIEERRFIEAKQVLRELGNQNFMDVNVIFLGASIEQELGNLCYAIQLHMRAINILEQVGASDDVKADAWGNLSYCLHQAWSMEEGITAAKKSIELNPNNHTPYINIGAAYNALARPDLGEEYARKALELNPSSIAGLDGLGIAKLLKQEWKEGWEFYEVGLGKKYRKEWTYPFGEERWDGSKKKVVIIYGEQGLGDEILFASIFNEAIEDCEKIIIDCDPRLEGLFKRSFPEAAVFGTRQQKDGVFWNVGVSKVDSRCSMGTLPKFYRNSDDQFPGGPYLIADPDRRVQWRALFDSQPPRLKIGIAWTGGTIQSGRKNRCIPFEDLKRLCEDLSVFWVSLEYLDPDERTRDIPIHHWKRGTDTEDYDDTAALVKELDLVICVPTTVTHLAGALGKETWCLVPKHPNWRFGLEGDSNIWHSSVKHIRQGESETWGDVVDRVRVMLEERYAHIHRVRRKAPSSGDGADVQHLEVPERAYGFDSTILGTEPSQT